MSPFNTSSSQKLVVVAAVGLAAISVGRLATVASAAAHDRAGLCNGKEWSWSLSNDCFRFGFLFPSLVLTAVVAGSILMAMKLLSSSSIAAVDPKPICRPPGNVRLVDNRAAAGAAIALLSILLTVLAFGWQTSAATNAEHLYSASIALAMLLIAVASLYYYATYLQAADRTSYKGLFPPYLAVTIGILLTVNMVEIYYSFFTLANSKTPFWFGASNHSRYLLLVTTANIALLFLHGIVQRQAMFLRPHRASMDESDECAHIESDSDTVQTPLAQKRKHEATPALVDTPEFGGSWFDTLTFSWVNDIFYKGSRRQLGYADLYKLDPSDTVIPNWRRYTKYRKHGRSLLVTLGLTFAPLLLAQFLLSLVIAVLHYSGPFFLQRVLQSVEALGNTSDKPAPTKTIRSAYLDAFGLLVVTLVNTLNVGQVAWIGRHLEFRMKGLLVAELSTKTLDRRSKGTLEGVAGDDGGNDDDEDYDDDDDDSGDEPGPAYEMANGKILNILTTDLNRLGKVSAFLDDLYVLPLLAIIGFIYMFQLLGWSSLIGFSIVVPYYPITRKVFSYLSSLEERTSELNDERVEAITELLQGIKAVKLYGWESQFLKKIDEHRERQLDSMWRWLLGWAYASILTSLIPMLVMVLIFVSYVGVFRNPITAEIAFTAISVFQLLRITLEHFPDYLSWVISGYVSLKRIQSYLAMPQAQDLEERVRRVDGDDDALGFVDACLVWDSCRKDNLDGLTDSDEVAADVHEGTPLVSDIAHDSRTSVDSQQDQLDMTAFALKNINVRFPAGDLSLVSGPTGSGKSSLLSALIGEMSLTSGSIQMPTLKPLQSIASCPDYQDVIELSREQMAIHDIAYVAQEAWLRNATIRENILFGEPYNQERYEEVLRVCALKPDLRILAAGDQTEIGERGVTLSGGQKQRVALARAVYSDRKILLIDDCLSAVDAHTAKHILMECLLNKTSLMQGRTRVLVTHHVSMCLPYAQYITVMREGEIALKGNPQELQALGKFSSILAELDTKNGAKSDDDDSKGKAVEDIEDIEDEGSAERAKAVNDMTSEDDYNTERLRKLAVAKGLDPNADLSAFEGTLIEDEEREIGRVKSDVWLTFCSACGNHWYWIVVLLLNVLASVLLIAQDYWIRIWVGVESTASPNVVAPGTVSPLSPAADTTTGKQHSLTFWIGIYLAIGLFEVFSLFIKLVYAYTGLIKAARDIHARLVRSVIHATPRFFDSTPFGRIINRFSRDMASIGSDTLDMIIWMCADMTAAFGTLVIIIAVSPSFIFAAMCIMVIYVVIAGHYLESSRELKRLESNATAPLLSLFGELIQGVSSIRAFGIKKYYIMEAINRQDALSRPYYLTNAASRWLGVRIDSAGAFVSFFCAILILWNIHSLDAGLAGFMLMYSLQFSENMHFAVRNYSDNELNMNAVERITQYLKTEQEASAQSTPENKPASNWPKTGDLEIEDLVIEYVPNVPVLHGLNMSIKHGEKIGVVGRTGAGKSTLSLAFLRFIEAAKGRIVLDGVDIAKIGLEDLRRNVTIIPQDPVLFNGTIRFNLDPFGEYPDEIVWDALRRAHLVRERGSQTASSATSVFEGKASDSSLERMAGIFNSLEAEIKENGQNLSLGQRQLVALARALVRRSRLIVMDEATASVDFDTDDRIQRTIRGSEFANSTLFCIAHRLRTIIDYDRVLVLDKGKVAEFDTPANLLEKQDGIFRSMCEKSGEYSHLFAVATAKNA